MLMKNILNLCLFLVVIKLSKADTDYDVYDSEYEFEDDPVDISYPLILEDPGTWGSVLSLYKQIQKFYLPVPSRTDNKNCSSAVSKFLINLKTGGIRSWALKMGDSWGKIPDGFLFGNVHTLGMYEECLKVKGEAGNFNKQFTFKGKYCLIYYKSPNLTLTNLMNDEEYPTMVKSGPAMTVLLQPLPFYYATCMPSVCTQEDLMVSVNETFQSLQRDLKTVVCAGDGEDSLDGFDIFVLVLVIGLFFIAIIGTICDWLQLAEFQCFKFQHPTAIKYVEIITCFSLLKNLKKIMSYQTRDSSRQITCLHGIRTITLIWIITCHQYEFGIKFSVNTLNQSKYQDPPGGQLITNGYASVDTFFCISGILVAFRLFSPTVKKNFFCLLQAFFRRIIRLAPSIFVVAIFCATLLRFIGWGPRNHYLRAWVLDECRGNWWKDPLFIDNYKMAGNHGYSINDCLSHCWFTAVDMQLFLVTPLLLIPFAYSTIGGTIWLSIISLGALLVPPAIIYKNDLPAIPIPYISLQKHLEYIETYYNVPWCRAVPWIVGLWVGIFLVKKPANLPTPNYFFIFVGYIISIAIGLLVVMGLYNYNHVGTHDPLKLWMSVVYVAFSKPGWALAVSFVVVTCDAGHAGVVNKFLSWLGWRPLSRLTFCMYLITPVVQLWWSTVLFIPPYYTYTGKVFEISGVFFISFVLSVIVSVLVERPLLALSDRQLGSNSHNLLTSSNSEITPKRLE